MKIPLPSSLAGLFVGLGLGLAVVPPAAAQDTTPPTLAARYPTAGAVVRTLNQVEVIFSEPVQGVTTNSLLMNGLPAVNLRFGTPEQFVFEYETPPTGVVSMAFAPTHGITDFGLPPNPFAGGNWTLTLNPNVFGSRLIISELMADNNGTLNDNYGNPSDWIEIHNPDSIPVNLGGWHLTDDPTDLDKWTFPAFDIAANGYLVVFASNRNETNNPAFLHSNFQLAAGGEYLALVDPNGNIVSAFSPVYPGQSEDVSYGRDRSDPDILGFFSTPTPRAANSTSGSGFAPEITYSHEDMTFPTNRPFQLTLSTPNPNAVIYYALGTNTPGTNLGPNVFRYTNPISVTNTLAIRSRAFAPGLLPGPISSRTFFALTTMTNVVNFNTELPILVMHTYGQGVIPANSDIERFIYIQTFENDCGRASLTNKPTLSVRGITHARGSSTLGYKKTSFFVEIRDEFNDDKEVPLLGLPPESDWVLYAPNNFEPALMHNPLAMQLARDQGEYASRTRFVEVYICDNGTAPGPIISGGFNEVTTNNYRGIYVLMEKIKRDNNRVDIEKLEPEHTTQPEVTGGYLLSIDRTDTGKGTISAGGGSLNPLEPSWFEITNANRVAQRTYITGYFNSFAAGLTGANLTNAFLAGGALNTNHYSNYIDVQSWVRRHVHEVFTFNVDALRLSGYFYKDRGKKIEYGPAWDYDRTLASTDGRDANPRTWRSQAGDLGTDFFNFTPWWNPLFRAPDFWQAWIDQYQKFRLPGGPLTTNNVFKRIDEFYNELKDAQPRERLRWNITTRGTNGAGSGSYADEIQWKRHWAGSRLHFMDTNFLAMPFISSAGGMVTNGQLVTLVPAGKAGTSLIYTLDGTDPRLPNGFINPAALSNNGPVSINVTGNIRIMARSYNPAHRNMTGANNPPINSIWSGPTEASFYLSLPALRITEIMYNPPNPPAGNTNDPDNFEYIEVKNIGATPLNVNRFRLRGGVDFDFPNVTLNAGQHAVIVKHQQAFLSRYGAGALILGVYTNDNLANDGDDLVLQGPVREPILDFHFSDDWYQSTDGAGFSLQIVSETAEPAAWDTKEQWRPSGTLNGTPGLPDPGSQNIATVYVNEALTHTDPSPGDAIELYNPTASPVNIGGWFLTDNRDNPKKFRIPNGTTIPANGYIVFYQSNSFGVGPGNFALSSQGEDVYLFSGDANTNLTGYVHGFDFGPQVNGATFGRHVVSTGNDHFVTQISPTLGSANSGPQVGPIVINEINYHPPDVLLSRGLVDNCIDEFIELRNISASPQPLFDPANPANTWRLRDAVDYRFPQGVTIPAGGYVLVVQIDPSDAGQAAGFRARNNVPASVPLYGPYSGKLNNSGESDELVRPDVPEPPGSPDAGEVSYVLTDKVNYSASDPWPVAADGFGPSLNRRDSSAYGNDPANWAAAGLTPGAAFGGGQPPTITQQPADLTTLATRSASFTVVATGPGPLTYQWRFNGTPIYGATSSTLLLPAVTTSQAGEYSCVVLNPSGATISADATLTVLIPADITLHPADRLVRVKPEPTAAPDTNITLTVTATTLNPPLGYQWWVKYLTNSAAEPVLIPGATSTSLTITNVTTNSFGQYFVAVTDTVGTVFSSNATVYPLILPAFVTLPMTQSAPPAATVTLSTEITGFPPPFTYEWRLGSVGMITNVTDSTVNLFNAVTPATVGATNRYRVVVKNLANPQPGVASNPFADVYAAQDTDGDGITDDRETAAGFNPNDANDLLGDADNDGMTNGEELIAGTDPRDNTSFLEVEESTTPGIFIVRVSAKAGRSYTVQYTDGLSPENWQKLADIAAGTTDRVVEVQDPTSQPDRFYRIVVPGQP